VDGYFAVTGSWVEELTPHEWKVQTALLGFTRLNNAHNGKRLGQALFKLVKRVGIAHKVWCSSFVCIRCPDIAVDWLYYL
jgi:hypothetical protein